jgi:hypothetical protein
MKKIFIIAILSFSTFLSAQNLQVLYDFGKDRNYVTTTLEMFKPDKWGSSFFFVDFYYDYGPEKHPSGAYMEITRSLNFWNGPISAHLEYNGGLGTFPINNGQMAYPINNAWLIGADYNMHNADFTKTLTLQAMFKHIVGKQESAQITAVWGLHFFKRKLSFTGFTDFWLENNTNADGKLTHTTFLTQPQLWYNFTEHLSAGTEVEFANNFAGTDGFIVRPRLAVKWNF